jgi:AcrR family transcriptional regulator
MVAAAPYHHGDLRAALVDAALAIVEREGMAGLSLRALARSAGVSPMAPYHHFADRAALLAAVAEIGFHRLYADKLAALATITDPQAALVAGSKSYVAFIIANPELYRLMKSPELADRARHPALATAAAAPAGRLRLLLQQLADAGRLQGVSPDAAAAMLWSLVHGTGLLAIDGYIPKARAVEIAADATSAMLAGFEG